MTYLSCWAFAPQALNFAITVNLVVLEHSQLRLLALVLYLLRSSVHLLLALLGTSTETQHEMQRRLFREIVVANVTAIFELLAGED